MQSSTNPKYYNAAHALYSLTLKKAYNLQHVIPTILVYTFNPLIKYSTSIYISQYLFLSPELTPLLYHLSICTGIALRVFVTTPFELARKRIQLNGDEFDTLVNVSDDNQHIGLVLASVIRQEGRVVKRRRKAVPEHRFEFDAGNEWREMRISPPSPSIPSSSSNGTTSRVYESWLGLKSLFRGFWARFAIEIVNHVFDEMNQDVEW